MRHSLYSELRTIYEATNENPRTFRITIKFKDMVDEAVLVHAVRKTMKRYPYFRVRLGIDENEVFFEDNPMPTPVLHTDHPIMLGGYETQGHLLAFCWWKNKVHIDAWHALTDGGRVYHLNCYDPFVIRSHPTGAYHARGQRCRSRRERRCRERRV